MTDDEQETDELGPRKAHREQRTTEKVDWEEVPTDPSPDELGYETEEWERIPTAEQDQLVFLPGNEEDIEDAAFVVLEKSDLCDLVKRR